MSFTYTETELRILKNFSGINKNIKIDPDTFSVVNAPKKSVVGFYNLETKKDHDSYSVYDLGQYLEVINSCHPDYSLSVTEKSIDVKNNVLGSTTKYNQVASKYVPEVKSPAKKFASVTPELKFKLSEEKLKSIRKISGLLGHTKIYFESADVGIRITCGGDDLLTTENPHTFVLNETEFDVNNLGSDIVFLVIEEMLVFEGEYNVAITSKGISHWENTSLPLEYFIGVGKFN